MRYNAKRLLAILWVLCYATPIVLAQSEAAEERKWTVRIDYRLADSWADFNSRGLARFLEANAFDHRESSSGKLFSSDLEYPLIGTEDASWSGLVAYSIWSPLSVGGAFYQTMDVEVDGLRVEPDPAPSGRITLQQTMRAVAPIALWNVRHVLVLGGGPAFLWGGTAPYDRASEQRLSRQETTFQRLGAVLFASLGFTAFNRQLYLGLQIQFLYGGTTQIGPFRTEESLLYPDVITLDAQTVRLDQRTFGPVIALHL